MKFQKAIWLVLTFFVIHVNAQVYPILVVAKVDAVKFDESTFESQKREDSLRVANAKEVYDTLKNGTIVSTKILSMGAVTTNPYLLTVETEKSFSNTIKTEEIIVRAWEHENPNMFFNMNKPFLFVISGMDSTGVYQAVDYYRVFKTWLGKWAEPLGMRKKIYRKSRKAILPYKLLRERETKYYQLIEDEVACCIDQLKKLYGLR